MTTPAPALQLEDRLVQLFRELGIGRAHVGGGYAADAVSLARASAESIVSMTLVCPFRLPPDPFRPLGTRLLLIHGDRGPGAESLPRAAAALPEAQILTLHDYADAAWSDAVADRRAEIEPALLTFLADPSQREALAPVQLAPGDGEIAGITYRVHGSGPPLILLPLTLARSQWDPLLPALAERYTTIVLGGAWLGMIPTLEKRMQGGYRGVVRAVVEAAQVQSGQSIVEVGCGSGAVVRWLARFTGGANPITAIDVNDYLLREAQALTRSAGLSDRVAFEHGDAESLPLPSDSVDVALSFTVMEEVDADRMLSEMVRITRPGGHVGVVVRASDLRPWVNVSVRPDLLTAVESVPGAGAADLGCSDASLYRRFRDAGLKPLSMGPQLAPDRADASPERLRLFVGRISQGLPADTAREFRAAAQRAVDSGTMIWAEPYHCAVAIKP
ncbi:MAG: class I SAM-dependent methyltransferase [Chloroflexi bacterium]|nr:class I SAM-dependent methyltransferase [Chloroflexota bacterium]